MRDSRIALLNILEDIDEAKGVAETERDKTKAIIENFPEGLLFFNKENRLVSINPKAQRFFSVPTRELIGREFEKLTKIKLLAPLESVLRGSTGKVVRKEITLRKDLVLEMSSIDIKRKGIKVGTLVVLRDITREKIVEKLKTEFVSIAAHQLRTPLSAIKWTLNLILDGDMGHITEEQRGFLKKTYQSNERMIYLINDLLNVTRIEEGRFLYKVEPRDIIKLAKGIMGQFRDAAKRKGLDFEVNIPKEKIPEARVDEEKLALVFQNLIENAIRYTPKGGKVVVSIKYQKEEKQILVSVKDTGIGVPREQAKRVFSRFFRAANAIRAETEGTGLGLYIAKNIVESHGGKIWFETKEKQGSTFYFTLPAP